MITCMCSIGFDLTTFRRRFCWLFAIGLYVLPTAVAVQAKAPEIGEKRDVVYVRRGGNALLLDAYLLSGPDSHPAAVFVHGGGFVAGDKALVLTHNYALNWDLFFDSSVGNDSGCRL
jgi:hypothetical protein